jgi:hypothetical protein
VERAERSCDDKKRRKRAILQERHQRRQQHADRADRRNIGSKEKYQRPEAGEAHMHRKEQHVSGRSHDRAQERAHAKIGLHLPGDGVNDLPCRVAP